MNNLVKILYDDDGEKVENPKWHLAIFDTGMMAYCSGEFFGLGESRVVFETKETKKGGITCANCLYKIKLIKSVKL